MLLSQEIRRKIENKREEMKTLKESGKINEAYDILNDIKNLNKEMEMALMEEQMAKEHVENKKPVTVENVSGTRVFNKLLNGMSLTDSEKEYANKHILNASPSTGNLGSVNERGGYLLPEEQVKEIYELRRKRRSLKELCRIKNATTRTGKYNVEGDNKLELLNFEELDSLQEKDLKFAQKSWSIKDYGLLIPVSNQLLQDVDVNLVSYIGSEFTKAAIRTENKVIVEKLKAINVKTIKDMDDMGTILNVDLDPAISENARIVTNQTSFDYLDKQKDGNGLPLLQPCLTEPTKKMYKGKVIEVFSDEEIQPKTSGNLVYYVGDFEEFMTFYDMKGIEVAKSEEAGFKQYATWLRAVERFDVGVIDDKAVVHAEFKPVAK